MKSVEAAWLAARALTGGNQNLASSVVRAAELAVMRRLLARLLPEGEEGYWQLVKEEIERE